MNANLFLRKTLEKIAHNLVTCAALTSFGKSDGYNLVNPADFGFSRGWPAADSLL
jgi:hypothetical protein